jgi:hypothetical protein
MQNQADRLDLLEARNAIADLVYRYAQLVREGRGAECGPLFTDDAVFEVREAAAFAAQSYRTRSTLAGRDAIVAYVERSAGPQARVCPLIHNLVIRVDGAEAVAHCVMTALLLPSGLSMLGAYHDTFRREDRWRFRSRIFTIVSAASGAPEAKPA